MSNHHHLLLSDQTIHYDVDDADDDDNDDDDDDNFDYLYSAIKCHYTSRVLYIILHIRWAKQTSLLFVLGDLKSLTVWRQQEVF